MLRFLHITDTHIGPTESFELYGRSPLKYLRRLVEEINALGHNVDFVLHTGDVVDDRSVAAYQLYEQAIDDLTLPVHHVPGNHDDPAHLQRIVMGISEPADRLDYTFDAHGVRFIVLDTRGPVDPGGFVEPDQLDWLTEQIDRTIAEGMPIVVAMHHSIVPLDTPWLDAQPPAWPQGRFMFTENASAVRPILAKARDRIRCVLSGHVHGAFVVQSDGVLYAPSQSVFAGLTNAPHEDRVVPDPNPRGHYNLVTITDDGQTIIRQRTFEI